MSCLCRPFPTAGGDRRLDAARAAGFVRRDPALAAALAARDVTRLSLAGDVARLSADLADLARWMTHSPFPHDRTPEGHRAEVLDALAEARRKFDRLTDAVLSQEF